MTIKPTFQKDIEDVQSLSIVPTILDVVCRATGLQFAAVARVTEENWVTCGVLDKIPFGLAVGDELEISTTFCNQVRNTDKIVVIDHVDEDSTYNDHPIPLQYGFQSYISVPIIRNNGDFFGTLCALDTKPNSLNNAKVIDMFTMFSSLIAFHLDTIHTVEKQQLLLDKKENQLETYNFISSHDLQEPLRKIQILTSTLEERERNNLSHKGLKYLNSIKDAATRMRQIVNDLIKFTQTTNKQGSFQTVDLNKLVNKVLFRLQEQIEMTNAVIQLEPLGELHVLSVQIEQLFYNILSNCIKFKSDQRPLLITIKKRIVEGSHLNLKSLSDKMEYCEITIRDNGIGIDSKYGEKIFEMFQRLSPKKDESTGMGLTIAKRIAQNHGGDIFVHGELNSFTEFKLYLPTA